MKDVRNNHLILLKKINFLFILKGLPWQGLKAAAKSAKYEKICERKLHTPLESLCINMPSEFSIYLQYCRKLEFTDEPNYHYLLELFDDLFLRHAFVRDYVYDWNLIRFRRGSTTNNDIIERPVILTNKRSKSLIPVVTVRQSTNVEN